MSWRESLERGERQRQMNRGAAAGLVVDRPSRPGVSRPKPLHWTRMRLIAVALAALTCIAGTLTIAGTGGGDVLVRVMFWGLAGCLAGLVAVSVLERIGVFGRTDE